MPINMHGAFEQIRCPNHHLLPNHAARAVKAYDAAAGEAVSARRRLHDLQSPTALGRARNEDVAEFKSTKKPTHAAVDRLKQDVEDAEQASVAYAELALDAEREMIGLVRTAERPDPDVALADAREAFAACEAALHRATEAQALVAWMSDPTRPFGVVQPHAVQALREVGRLLAPREQHTPGRGTDGIMRPAPSYAIPQQVLVVEEVGS